VKAHYRSLKLLLALSSMLWAASAQAKIEPGPPLGFTGAPAEGTCVSCHYTYGVPNPPGTGGSVQITGLPASYTPGQSYNVTVTVAHPTARAWGFELTAIDRNGTSNTIGTLNVTNSATTLKRDSTDSGAPRTYLSHHGSEGIARGKIGSNSWSFTWNAPATNIGDVTFYAVGNAANNQVSPEGDYIYSTSVVVRRPNQIPVLAALPDRVLAAGDRISFTVAAADADGDALAISASALADAEFNPVTRRFSFTPDAPGFYEVTFTVSDGLSESQRTVGLQVTSAQGEDLSSLSTYLESAGASGVDLVATGDFGAAAKIVFNGLELQTQAAQGVTGVAGTIPAAELTHHGAYVVRVRRADGSLSNARALALAAQINAQPATMVEAAAYGATIAPGEIAAVFGLDLIVGDVAESAAGWPLPRALRQTTVYVNGVAAPLFYAGDGQVNCQIPYRAGAGGGTVVVLRGDGIAARGTAQVAEAAPAIFTIGLSGQGQAAALNPDYSLNGDPGVTPGARRVVRGSYITLYGTGAGGGFVDAATGQLLVVREGEAASVDPLAKTSSAPEATVGGKAASVHFSGLAPGYAGLWQLNVGIPTDAPSGAAVDVILSYGGRSSNRVTIAVE
jgi:uncharacterized protein (TIGR03437 family)